MVVRLSAEWGDNDREASRIIKLFPQEYDLLILGLLYWRDRLTAIRKSDANYGIMKTFEKIIDQIIEEDRQWRRAAVSSSRRRMKNKAEEDEEDIPQEQEEEQKGMIIKVEYDEFLGVMGLQGPMMGRDLAGWKLIDEDEAKYKESHDGHYSLNDMVFDWLRRPDMRKKIKIVDSGSI
jgi:hypothetical protein